MSRLAVVLVANACSICAHPKSKAIDHDLVGGVSLRTIASNYSTARNSFTISGLSRHRQRHVSPALQALVRAEVADDHSRSLLERLEGHLGTVDRLLATAEADGSLTTALAGIREARGLIELVARLSGELDTRPQTLVLNLSTSAEWVETRGMILQALNAYPDARRAVVAALSGAVVEGRVIEA
ncbi:hypothetical protein GALL_341390 [mine drainage metagenome]|uniref:Uncharacterized protein n=1 Tax=mine drainage metagenome TaxID=410659 RepID=A0A1J5R2T9_9ZZZZ